MENPLEGISFKPQNELVYNQLLPYYSKLDEESLCYLTNIKSGLGNSVLHREIKPATLQWLIHLTRYIKLYGCKFSKEDHLHFIHLLLELLVVPDLEPFCVQNIADTLSLLLKKTRLLSRQDLIIEWQPLYNLYKRTVDSGIEGYGLLSLPSSFEGSLKGLIRLCRNYFSVESTQEMLDEWRPMICIFDNMMVYVMNYCELFLCTKLPPEEHDRGYKLWLDEFMNLWGKCQNIPQWENNLTWLLSRVAFDHIGCIDWEPYISLIFTKILRGFHLPGSHSVVFTNQCQLEIHPQVLWIVSMLGGNSSCQLHINRLFKALESYYHPSNGGRWVVKLQRFLQKLPELLVARLYRERYKEPSWDVIIPQQCKLTNADVTEFVLSLRPAALLSIFSKFGSIDSASALKYLAQLRPELIIPSVVERMWSSLETVTEPHRLTAAMQCVASIAESITFNSDYYPEGRSHVLPLLMGALPGIDPNDFKKCIVTFQLISLLGSHVLFVDASKDVDNIPNLTEVQRELCLSTASFEDFVLQYMDRCFALVENGNFSNLNGLDRENSLMNTEENLTEMGLTTCFSTLLSQCSPDICKAAINKLYNFVSNRIFGIKISGKYAANLCRTAAKVCPAVALPIFIPHFSKLVLNLTEQEEVLKEENLDEELLFSLLLLSEVVRCNGQEVLKYRKEIENVLQKTLQLRCKHGCVLAATLLRHTLKSFTLLHPIEYCSIPNFKSRCETEPMHVFLKDWGKLADIYNLDITFHTPNAEEVKAVQDFCDKFLLPELDKLGKWACNEVTLTRDDVLCSLTIVYEFLNGASSCLPTWQSEKLNLCDSTVPCFFNPIQVIGTEDINTSDGKNIRLLIYTVIKKVLNNIMANTEDDVKSANVIILIYQTLLFSFGIEKESFEAKWKSFHVVKKILKSRLAANKQYIRQLLIDRVNLQHQMRLMKRKSYFTEIHKEIMSDMFKLSISHYAEVRISAQSLLRKFIASNLYSYQWILPNLLQVLAKDPVVFHKEFKGVLYLLIGKRGTSLLLMPFWDLTRQLWPALVASSHSEKHSIIKLFDHIVTKMFKNFYTSQLELNIPASCLEKAKKLWDTTPNPLSSAANDDDIEKSLDKLSLKNDTNKRLYLELIHTLCDLVQSGNLHWQHYNIASHMLLILLRYDIRAPDFLVQLFMQQLVHDTVAIRKNAIFAVTAILRQQKKTYLKKAINPASISTADIPLHPILREYLGANQKPTNLWLQYNSFNSPTTEEKWNQSIFVHKKYIGLNALPKELMVYEDVTKQPKLNRTREDLDVEEYPVYDSLMNPEYVEKFIKYLSLEEKKGQEKFDYKSFLFFQGLFRNFGDIFLPNFWNHIERLVKDNQESSTRCAAEIIAGLIQGSKRWNFWMMESLKERLTPILKLGLQNVYPETTSLWASCIKHGCDNRDPNRCCWLYELFFEKPHTEEAGSFLDSSWLYFLRMALVQHPGRMFEFHHRFITDLLPQLNHSYHNVREKLARFLDHIFAFDMTLDIQLVPLALKRSKFLEKLMPHFEILQTTITESSGRSNASQNIIDEVPNVISSEMSEERKTSLNLFQTVCRWILYTLSRTVHYAPTDFFQMLPILCAMQVESDEEIQSDGIVAITLLGNMVLPHDGISLALTNIKAIADGEFWHSRLSVVHFLKIMVSCNLFSIMHNEDWLRDITDLILKFLHDVSVEIRESAGEALSGFIHCEVIKIDEELLATFKGKCQRKLQRLHALSLNEAMGPLQIGADEMISRHAGIVGLCACVNAFPYDVPDFMPDILVLLGDHINDPQPIPATIKKTLSNFRRTHYDNWRDHQLKFTEDQLNVITDLLVSPSYYA